VLSGQLVPKTVLLLLLVKAIIWSTALGSGTSGGVLAPLFIIGGAAGAAMAGILPVESSGLLALLGMAAAMSGAMRVPLTATFFAAEVTGNMQALLPLLTASATAYVITVLLMKRSILTEKITRRGHHIVCEYNIDSFVLTRVRDVMTTTVESVPATMNLHEVARFLTAPTTTHPTFPVVDADNHVLGIVDPPSVLRWRREGWHRKTILQDLLTRAGMPLAYPDEYVERAAERLTDTGLSHLAVVSREDRALVGYIGWKDITQMRAKHRAVEARRMAFFGRRAPSAAEARAD
jgi:CIC family chloride channel protein